jgi:hypothetical protein
MKNEDEHMIQYLYEYAKTTASFKSEAIFWNMTPS